MKLAPTSRKTLVVSIRSARDGRQLVDLPRRHYYVIGIFHEVIGIAGMICVVINDRHCLPRILPHGTMV